MEIKKNGARGRKALTSKPARTQVPTATIEVTKIGRHAGVQLDAGLEDEIRRRAYELYEARGRVEGFDQEDWSQAEAEVLSRHQQ